MHPVFWLCDQSLSFFCFWTTEILFILFVYCYMEFLFFSGFHSGFELMSGVLVEGKSTSNKATFSMYVCEHRCDFNDKKMSIEFFSILCKLGKTPVKIQTIGLNDSSDQF